MYKIGSYILVFLALAITASLLLFIHFSFYRYHNALYQFYRFVVLPYLTPILIGMSIIHIAINKVAVRPEWGYSDRALSFFWFSRLFIIVGVVFRLLAEIIFGHTPYNT